MKDDFGDRMKSNYEDRTRYLLPRRTYTIVRLDGKAFHSLTKKLKCVRPFDENLMAAMNYVAQVLCANIQGCKLAYVQSDEISLLLTDFEDVKTDAYFDGNIQKIASISAAMAAVSFNYIIRDIASNKLADDCNWNIPDDLLPIFDARVFSIPDREEVINYFIWRQKDCVRNSIQMLAQSLYSHKELQGIPTSKLQEYCFKKGKNWNDCNVRSKRGGMVVRELVRREIENKKTHEKMEIDKFTWVIKDAMDFHKSRESFGCQYIPVMR